MSRLKLLSPRADYYCSGAFVFDIALLLVYTNHSLPVRGGVEPGKARMGIMSGKINVPRMSDYLWISVGEHIRYIEHSIGLEDFNSEHVYSMRMSNKTGALGLLRRKIALKSKVDRNIAKIAEFIEGSALDDDGKALIAVIINNMVYASDMMKEQITTLDRLLLSTQGSLVYEDLDQTSPPF